MNQQIHTLKIALLCGLGLAMAFASVASGEEAAEEKPGWEHNAEFSLVATGGNSEAGTFGLTYALAREWEKSRFKLGFSGLRAESDTGVRVAFGTPDNFEILDQRESEVTAENYSFTSRYERDISKKFFWYMGDGWTRNEFAGVRNRFILELGAGNVWFKSEKSHFQTSYAVTGTHQEDVVEGPDDSETFLGLRVSWDFFKQLTESTTYTNKLVVDENLDDSSDLRADMEQALAVSISKRLALKASLKLLYDNQPSFESLVLTQPDGSLSSVLVELDELDILFKTALVVTF